MKTLLLAHVAVLLLCSCGLLKTKDEVEEFIQGVYIRCSQHEYGTEYDTIVISVQNRSANEYHIVRMWKYERVLDGIKIEPEYKLTEASGIYYSKNKILQDTEAGDILSFDVK